MPKRKNTDRTNTTNTEQQSKVNKTNKKGKKTKTNTDTNVFSFGNEFLNTERADNIPPDNVQQQLLGELELHNYLNAEIKQYSDFIDSWTNEYSILKSNNEILNERNKELSSQLASARNAIDELQQQLHFLKDEKQKLRWHNVKLMGQLSEVINQKNQGENMIYILKNKILALEQERNNLNQGITAVPQTELNELKKCNIFLEKKIIELQQQIEFERTLQRSTAEIRWGYFSEPKFGGHTFYGGQTYSGPTSQNTPDPFRQNKFEL